ncbi:SLBB domain-containing protein [Aminithiophilus ramosus]|uniref:SLBB domain-containing protein n=1 Tax=Aminithiophilus ramosus TaxID=3029084 RepID=A0A9Q7AM46_9BACT|nr:SLBB domain-containing protein [Aminithiophilus ramosus]
MKSGKSSKKVFICAFILALAFVPPAVARAATGAAPVVGGGPAVSAEGAAPSAEGTLQSGAPEGVAVPDGTAPENEGEAEAPEGVEEIDTLAPVDPDGDYDGEELDHITGAMGARITARLSRFGYGFFRGAPSTFAPVSNVPVGPDYVIGPGDVVRIHVWGMVEGNWSVTVDRNGNLSLPQAGVVGVGGLSFSQARDVIEGAYGQYFTNFDINVSMGELRSLTVYVTGNARRPGAYTVSSLSTLVNALLASGGPSPSGTMRAIELKRGGKTVVTFDVYDLLLKGDKTKDVRLMPGDVIFIPPVGALVGITGDVKVPAYYEIKGQARLKDLLAVAGGLTSRHFRGRLQVDRTENNQYRTTFETDLENLDVDPRKNIALQDGDLVKVYAVLVQKSTVVLSGAVANPGSYAIEEGYTRLSDVLNRSGGLLYTASTQGEITRVHVTQEGPVTERIAVDFAAALRGERNHDVSLKPNDYIQIRNVPEWDLYTTVSVGGQVRSPGTYTIKKGERLSDLIERAGGFTGEAFPGGAVFSRESVRAGQQKQIDEMIRRLEQGLYSGAAAAAGSAMTGSDAQLVQVEAEQKSRFLAKLKESRADGRVVVAIPENYALLKGSPYDMELLEGDTLFVPRRPQTINVVGAVYSPTAFVYRPGQPYTAYIRQAGDFSVNADRRRVYIVKADGSAVRGLDGKKPRVVEEGDAIVVPEKIDVKNNLRDFRDIIDIVYKVAVAAKVVLD